MGLPQTNVNEIRVANPAFVIGSRRRPHWAFGDDLRRVRALPSLRFARLSVGASGRCHGASQGSCAPHRSGVHWLLTRAVGVSSNAGRRSRSDHERALLSDIYRAAAKDYAGRFTVPLLWTAPLDDRQ